jgi:iron complex transport system ATP-binding protein
LTSPILEFRNVSFSRGSRLVLDELSFSIEKREMVALLGPNGIGKTTLLQLACHLLLPASGEILLQDKPLDRWSRQQLPRCIALVPQQLEIPFDFRVEEIVAQGRVPYIPLFSHSTALDREAVEKAMQAVDILNLRHRYYSELSGGERQRVKIAIGLAQQPNIILLDEPTQHLDIGRQIELIALLRELNQQGITIIAAVHDLNLVAESFSSVILLTPEPSWIAGPVGEVLRPDFLERAFSVEQSALANYCVEQPRPEIAQLLISK